MEIDVHGASSQTLTGEIGLSEIQNDFADVFICPETMKLHQKSLRETHLEATVVCFEFSSEFVQKPKGSRGGQGAGRGHLRSWARRGEGAGRGNLGHLAQLHRWNIRAGRQKWGRRPAAQMGY